MLWSLVIRNESIVGVNKCLTIGLFIIFGGKGLLKKAIFCVLKLHLVIFGKFLFLILNISFLGKLFLRAAITLPHFLLFSGLLLVEANVLIQPSYSFSSFPDTFAATAILLVSAFTVLLSI